MKYTETNAPLICMQSNSTCYKGTRTMEVKGILWHSTGANNPNLKRYIQPADNAPDRAQMLELLGQNKYNNDYNHREVSAGLNAWIGKLADGTVAAVQTMPWDYRPWGCGSGKKGSCNNGWLQFEICEDNLENKEYFEAVYQEACELTAYLCTLHNLDPKGTADNSGVETPVILCHADAYKLGLGSNHGDVNHWFKKYNKTMEDVRNDVAQLLEESQKQNAATTNSYYRVRKEWEDSSTQIGAYIKLENAIAECKKAGSDYYVFDPVGNVIYPEIIVKEPEIVSFKVGDAVALTSDAVYASGQAIPAWVKNSKLYVRQIRTNGDHIISTLRTGAVTGVVNPKFLVEYQTKAPTANNSTFIPYLIRVTASALNVRSGAGTTYKVATTLSKGEIHTIIDEKDGWGKLKNGSGWISLKYTAKV